MAYPKFRNDQECAYPERADCNYGSVELSNKYNAKTEIRTIKTKNYARCEFMKCVCMGNWKCTYTKGE